MLSDGLFLSLGKSSNLFLYKDWYMPSPLSSSLCVPVSEMTPLSKTIILEAFSIVDSLWAITMVVLLVISFSKASWTINSDSVSSDDVASSKIIIGESL